MSIRERLSGNEAISLAIKQINPDVMPAFPITPSTEIPQFVANYIANGKMDTEFIPVESEHSSMSATIGASAAGTCKDAIDALRAQGKKVGLLKLRVFRPFPAEEIAAALSHCKSLAIMDRCDSFSGNGGPLGAEVSQALYNAHSSALAVNYIYGLGGRDIRVEDFEDIYSRLERIAETGEITDQFDYIGLRR